MKRAKARDTDLRVRFSSDELAAVRRKARAEGIPVSTYVRRLALTTPSAAEAERERAERVKRAIAALGTLPDVDAEAILRAREESRLATCPGSRR